MSEAAGGAEGGDCAAPQARADSAQHTGAGGARPAGGAESGRRRRGNAVVELLRAARDGGEAGLGVIRRLRWAVGARDMRGWTALHYGVLFGRADAVRALLLAGASPGAGNTLGRTAVDMAGLWDTDDEGEQAVAEQLRALLAGVVPAAPMDPGRPPEEDEDVPLVPANGARAGRRGATAWVSRRGQAATTHWSRVVRDGLMGTAMGPSGERKMVMDFLGRIDGTGAYKAKRKEKEQAGGMGEGGEG